MNISAGDAIQIDRLYSIVSPVQIFMLSSINIPCMPVPCLENTLLLS